jgi:hypothetical protein
MHSDLYTSFSHHTNVGRANKNTVNYGASDENDSVDRRVIRVHSECVYQLFSLEQKSVCRQINYKSNCHIFCTCIKIYLLLLIEASSAF